MYAHAHKRDAETHTRNLSLSDGLRLMSQRLNNIHTHTHIRTFLPEVIGLPYINESLLSLNSIIHAVICVCILCEAGMILGRCVSTMGAGRKIKVCNSHLEEIIHALMTASILENLDGGNW